MTVWVSAGGNRGGHQKEGPSSQAAQASPGQLALPRSSTAHTGPYSRSSHHSQGLHHIDLFHLFSISIIYHLYPLSFYHLPVIY